MTARQDTLLEIQRKLQDIYDFVAEAAKADPTFGGDALRLKQHITQDLMWVQARLGNTALGGSVGFSSSETNPLVHSKQAAAINIMGKPLAASTPVTPATLVPSTDRVAQFKQRVDDLYNAFPGLKDRDLQAIISQPGGENEIRGVAKKAGMIDAKSRDSSEIDAAYWADIRAAIKQRIAGDFLTDTIDRKLKANEDGNLDDIEPTPATAATAPQPKAKKAAPATKGKPSILDDEDDE